MHKPAPTLHTADPIRIFERTRIPSVQRIILNLVELDVPGHGYRTSALGTSPVSWN